MKYGAIGLVVIALSTAPVAFAREQGADTGDLTSQNSPTVETMESLRSEVAILKAELEVAKARSDLDTITKSRKSQSTLPKIESIYGSGSAITAKLTLPDGSDARAGIGSVLSGGYRVVSIDHAGVVVERRGRRVALLFAAYVPQPAYGSSPIPGMPQFPSVQSMPLPVR